MDFRICKNNFFQGECIFKTCHKFHLRRENEETILIDTYANFQEHREIKKTQNIQASFPPGIKLHVFNVTDDPWQWITPITQPNIEIHNVVGFKNYLDKHLKSKPEFLTETKEVIAALLDIKDTIYSALSINIDKATGTELPPGATLLSNVLSMYNQQKIHASIPLFINAEEHSASLHMLLNQDGLKNTPIIWRNHNTTINNYTTSFPNSATNNHYFQINAVATGDSTKEIKKLINNNMLTKILPTSQMDQLSYHPHLLLHTICNIHQAIIDSGIKQELFTTNEQLIQNVLSTFSRLFSHPPSNGNPRLIGNKAITNLHKWYIPEEKPPQTIPQPANPNSPDTYILNKKRIKRSRASYQLAEDAKEKPAKRIRSSENNNILQETTLIQASMTNFTQKIDTPSQYSSANKENIPPSQFKQFTRQKFLLNII